MFTGLIAGIHRATRPVCRKTCVPLKDETTFEVNKLTLSKLARHNKAGAERNEPPTPDLNTSAVSGIGEPLRLRAGCRVLPGLADAPAAAGLCVPAGGALEPARSRRGSAPGGRRDASPDYSDC